MIQTSPTESEPTFTFNKADTSLYSGTALHALNPGYVASRCSLAVGTVGNGQS